MHIGNVRNAKYARVNICLICYVSIVTGYISLYSYIRTVHVFAIYSEIYSKRMKGKELNKLLCFRSNPIVVFLYVLYM